ncbi:glycoside hydrolase [Cokeromyces recurvatus]|uniref:glycoside hydrolase n=1 Tax=Cokeromyces recurvatus TaxID=90255 RepID=UPI00221F1F78|nr:glycoside hydrolase [Cokeromyces recurvatus]KAI7898486.1 glycoside hydrolase [Cokeromyces recurvatus]
MFYDRKETFRIEVISLFIYFFLKKKEIRILIRFLHVRELTKEMFNHGWNNYMQHAYPEDELNPFECKGRGSDKANPLNINVNDVLGDYSLTLVDTLDTLAIIGTQQEFEDAVNRVIETVSFSQDNKVQVFEVNIRALGGLLSAHLLATDPAFNRTISGYNNELLSLAKNVADRLMPAFWASKRTHIPYPRVNLRYGVPTTETTETCTAGAGSLILEFGVLSRLTGDPRYEQAAQLALDNIWQRRSELNLLGNVIDIQTGQWIHTASSTGAGIDSIFEYMLKAYILFGESKYYTMFDEAYQALMRYVRDRTGYLYRNVHMSNGSLMSYWIDSLGAFFSGLQVLAGDLNGAIKGHLVYYNLWKKYHALPERFNFYQRTVDVGFYPLRPEFVESTYYLYRATHDPFYLEIGEMIVKDLNNRTRLPCGFATIGDVTTGRLEDRMESFMLSETLKYLYLLFDVDHPLNHMDSNFVFTTEGHILPLSRHYLRSTEAVNEQCPKYHDSIPGDLDMSSMPYQPVTDYATQIVGTTAPVLPLSQHGYCALPYQTLPSKRIFFMEQQLNKVSGYLAKSLSGLRLELKPQGYFLKRG